MPPALSPAASSNSFTLLETEPEVTPAPEPTEAAFLESVAAEHAARMTSMDAATKNASDVIDLIKEGVMIGPASQQTAEIGRQYTKRQMPW